MDTVAQPLRVGRVGGEDDEAVRAARLTPEDHARGPYVHRVASGEHHRLWSRTRRPTGSSWDDQEASVVRRGRAPWAMRRWMCCRHSRRSDRRPSHIR